MKASIDDLIQKYTKGTASEEEVEMLVAYYESLESMPGLEDRYTSERLQAIRNEIKGAIDLAIDQSESAEQTPVPIWKRNSFLQVAAIFVVLALGFWFVQTFKRTLPSTSVSGIVHTTAHARKLIVLPDQTRVILEAGTELSYPQVFDGINREVVLNGEAFFDVAHQKGSTFSVLSDRMQIMVLGTAFHVRAFNKESENTVLVTRGEVKVEAGRKLMGHLKPAEKLTYHKVELQPLKTVFKKDESPTEPDELKLDDQSLGQTFSLIETLYATQIQTDPVVDTAKRFTASILKGESLEDVLNRIATFHGLSYQLNNDDGTIKIKLLAR